MLRFYWDTRYFQHYFFTINKSFIFKVHHSKKVNSFLAATGLKGAAHPPYSPDLAPSDFHLFGKLKKKIAGMEFASEDELSSEIIT